MRTLAEWLDLQQSVHARSIDLGLARVAGVARALDVHAPDCRVLTVGGTNGKGSTVALAESLLHAAGVRVGAFTSPHLVRYNERIRVGCEPAADDELVAAFESIEEARGATTLTFFEYSTLAALLVFARRRVDVAVLEVGLGGRLDATNLVDPDVAVVCSVGFDHREWLGETLDAIGAEKAGIFRSGRPAVLGSADMPASVHRAIEALGARPIVAGRDFQWRRGDADWSYHGLSTRLERLPLPALAGEIQLGNAATACAALEALGVPGALGHEAVSRGLTNVRLPGRFQIVPGEVEWILDVAHNEPAAQVFARNLAQRPGATRTCAVVGILGDKDIEAIGRAMEGVVDFWIVCPLEGPRGTSAAELASRLGLQPGTFALAGSVAEGCALAQRSVRPGERVVVFGSFHTVGPALQWLRLY